MIGQWFRWVAGEGSVSWNNPECPPCDLDLGTFWAQFWNRVASWKENRAPLSHATIPTDFISALIRVCCC